MKPTRERMDLASYPSQVDVPPRFSDVDMFKHLNNVAIGQFYEEVRFAMTADFRGKLPRDRGGAVIVANVDIAYLRQGKYPDVVTVGSGIAQRGRKSYVIGQALFQNGVCISAADTTLVYLENGAPAALPPQFDELFESLRLPTVVDER